MSHMVRMGLRPASLALAAALCFGTHVQAADDPIVAQSALTLSGLSFQLIDLTPGDGIAPSLSFQSDGLIDTGEWIYDEASDSYNFAGGPQFQNSLLPATPMTHVSSNGLSTVTSTVNSVTLQTQLPLSQLLPSMAPPDGTGTDDFTDSGSWAEANLSVGDGNTGGFASFTLGSGTGLILRGTLSSQLTMDSSAVSAVLAANGYDHWSLYGNLDAYGSFLMAAQAETPWPNADLLLQQGNQLDLSRYHTVWHGSNMWDDNTPLSDATSQSFEFTVVNFGDSNLIGDVLLNLHVLHNVDLFATRASTYIPPVDVPPIDVPPIDVPAIPEPSTYALMGLGLVGIVAVARRRRHTA